MAERRPARGDSLDGTSGKEAAPAESALAAKLAGGLEDTPPAAASGILVSLAKEGWLGQKQTRGRIDEVAERLIEAVFEGSR